MISFYAGYCTYFDDDTSIHWICEPYPDESVFMIQRDYRHEDHRRYQEHAFQINLSTIFNINPVGFVRKAMFSKSGYIGRVAKKRKGA